MTPSRVLARNTLYSFGAQVAPLVVAIVAIPRLIQALGASRFAILTLVWAAIGYFGLFDFGIGRALTHSIATRIGNGDTEQLGAITWTSLGAMVVFGVFGAVLMAAGTPFIIDHWLNVPADIRPDARVTFYVMAAAVPATLLAAGFRGILEAHQDFPVAAALRVPLGILSYLAPLAVLPFTHGLVPVVIATCAVRVAGCGLHALVCLRRYEFLRRGGRLDAGLLMPVLRYGGWLTVTNLVSPIMANLDRFMIGSILPVAAVAYYVTPFEMVTKLWIVPAAVLGVLFPAFAETFATDRQRTAALVDRAIRVIIVAIFPAALLVVCFASDGLRLWINADFARQSTPVLQWLAAGVLINCVGQVAFSALQGVGRPDLTAKVLAAEVPFYLAAVWWLTHAYGLVGVAIAWTLRVSVDTLALLFFMTRTVPETRRTTTASLGMLTGLTVVLAAAASNSTLGWRLGVMLAAGAAFVVVAWTRMIDPAERVTIRGWFVVRRAAV